MRFRSIPFWISAFIHLAVIGMAVALFMMSPEFTTDTRPGSVEVDLVEAPPDLLEPSPVSESQMPVETQTSKPDEIATPAASSIPAVPPSPQEQPSLSPTPPPVEPLASPASAPLVQSPVLPSSSSPPAPPSERQPSTPAASSSMLPPSTSPPLHMPFQAEGTSSENHPISPKGNVRKSGRNGDVASSDKEAIMDVKPDYLNNPPPDYPELSRHEKQEGTVVLEVIVDTEGYPSRIYIQTSSGFALLDQSAVNAVSNWRFRPASLGTLKMKSRAIIPVHFHLEN